MLEMERYILGRSKFPHGKEWTFRCPTCQRMYRGDEPGEPLCTGPSDRDDHPSELMYLLKVRTVEGVEKFTPPGVAEERASGPLFVP